MSGICTFSLANVLRVTAACNFSTSEIPKVLRTPRVLYTFSLANVLRATAACHFSTSELEKVLRTSRVLYIFTCKCVSRYSGVQFVISPLTTWLRTRRFNRPTFRLTRHTNHWKNTALRDFSNIWRGCIFFLLTFALLHLLSADLTTLLFFSFAFQVSILSEVYYFNFLRLWYTIHQGSNGYLIVSMGLGLYTRCTFIAFSQQQTLDVPSQANRGCFEPSNLPWWPGPKNES